MAPLPPRPRASDSSRVLRQFPPLLLARRKSLRIEEQVAGACCDPAVLLRGWNYKFAPMSKENGNFVILCTTWLTIHAFSFIQKFCGF